MGSDPAMLSATFMGGDGKVRLRGAHPVPAGPTRTAAPGLDLGVALALEVVSSALALPAVRAPTWTEADSSAALVPAVRAGKGAGTFRGP